MFTDIDMPGSMDGLKLAEAVRDRWPPVKIIIASGHRQLRDELLPIEGKFFSKLPCMLVGGAVFGLLWGTVLVSFASISISSCWSPLSSPASSRRPMGLSW